MRKTKRRNSGGRCGANMNQLPIAEMADSAAAVAIDYEDDEEEDSSLEGLPAEGRLYLVPSSER
jgi:hypothetical protein